MFKVADSLVASRAGNGMTARVRTTTTTSTIITTPVAGR